MFDQFKVAALKPGKTMPLVLDMLPGRPVVHLEHLGETNAPFWADQIARANARNAIGSSKKKITKKDLRELRQKKRDVLAKHGIRKLEALHSDKTPATSADIPDFVEAIPDDVVDVVFDYASNPDNYREIQIEGDPDEIAEKS